MPKRHLEVHDKEPTTTSDAPDEEDHESKRQKEERNDGTPCETIDVSNNRTGIGDGGVSIPRHDNSLLLPDLPIETVDDVVPYIDGGLRKIPPYRYDFRTHAKQRWLGRSIIDVVQKEFHAFSKEYYAAAVDGGRIKVNGRTVGRDYAIRHHDEIVHSARREEPPIDKGNEACVLLRKDSLLFTYKPSGMPVYPNGRYHLNSLQYAIKYCYRDSFLKDVPILHTLHRLDQAVGGLCLMSTSKVQAQQFEQLLREKLVRKCYIARVRGRFMPLRQECTAPIALASYMRSRCRVDEVGGKPCQTRFCFLAYDHELDSSLVACEPLTGRKHQIRVHLAHIGYPIVNDHLYSNLETDESELTGIKHSHGIWLHSVRYTLSTREDPFIGCLDLARRLKAEGSRYHYCEGADGENEWSFSCKFPSWAEPFLVKGDAID